MILAHRIQLDPTCKQRRYFAQACGTARLVWNWALAEWNEQYKAGGKPKAVELKRYFNTVKYAKFPWMKDIHRDAHAQPFANLQKAFQKFFKGEAKYPKFKKKGKSRDSFYVACDKFTLDRQQIRLPVVGSVRMTEALRLAGKIMSATVSREADRWFIVISVDMPEPAVKKPKGKPVGIDLGLKTFAVLSTGEHVDAPKSLAKLMPKLKRLQRRHSRKQLGSNNRRKAAMSVAKCHRRIKNIRRDFIHKFTTRIAKNHGEVCIEDLAVKNMVRNHCLARAISDAAWGETRRQFTYKTRLYGSELTVRDRFFKSSKTCNDCGHELDSLPLSVREWICPSCGVLHDRDENASKNLEHPYTDGLSGINASGDRSADVDLKRETAVGERRTTTVADSRSLTP